MSSLWGKMFQKGSQKKKEFFSKKKIQKKKIGKKIKQKTPRKV